jgi:hypothetical protein
MLSFYHHGNTVFYFFLKKGGGRLGLKLVPLTSNPWVLFLSWVYKLTIPRTVFPWVLSQFIMPVSTWLEWHIGSSCPNAISAPTWNLGTSASLLLTTHVLFIHPIWCHKNNICLSSTYCISGTNHIETNISSFNSYKFSMENYSSL